MSAKSVFYLSGLTLASAVAFLLVVSVPHSAAMALSGLALAAVSPAMASATLRFARWIGKADIFSPLFAFPIAYAAWFAIGCIDLLKLPGSFAFGAFDPIPLRIVVFAAIGLLGYFAGCIIARLPDKRAHAPLRFTFTWNCRLFNWFVFVLAIIAAGTYAYIGYHIGIPALKPNAAEARLELEKYHWFGTPFFAAAYTLLLSGAGRLWADERVTKRERRFFIFCLVVPLSAIFLSMAGRAILVPPMLTTLVMFHYLRSRFRFRSVVVIAVVVFALLSAMGYVRDLTANDEMAKPLEAAGLPVAVQPFVYCYFYIRYSVATLRDISEVIPNNIPYQHGRLTTLPFQALLPGHHEMADFFYKNILGNDFLGAGQPATILGTFYADFGVAGIFLGMLGVGFLLAILYRSMLNRRTVFSAMVYGWATQAALLGIFGGIFTYLDTLMIPLCWVALNELVREFPRPQASPAVASSISA